MNEWWASGWKIEKVEVSCCCLQWWMNRIKTNEFSEKKLKFISLCRYEFFEGLGVIKFWVVENYCKIIFLCRYLNYSKYYN